MMSPVTLFAFAGFFTGIALHVFLISILVQRKRGSFERLLLVLVTALLIWYAGNFLGLLLRQMNVQKVAPVLVWVDVVSFVGLGVLPALLYHTVSLYYRGRFRQEPRQARMIGGSVPLFYVPLIFLPVATLGLFATPELNPLEKLGSYQIPFLLYLAAAYYASSLLILRILDASENRVEGRVFRALLLFFLSIPLFNFWVFEWGGAELQPWGELLVQTALMASLFPAFAVAYFIYRYRFLNITVHRSAVTALLMLVTLVVYVYGVQRLGLYLERELEAPPLLLEVTFLATVLLFFVPLSRIVENWFRSLSAGEMRRYQALANSFSSASPRILSVDLACQWFEQLLERELELKNATIHLGQTAQSGGDLYELRVADRLVGHLEVEFAASPTPAEREGMRLLAHEVALALDRFRLMESKLRMERELSRKSHMENLGRMAASISHNVKNPLSSMKTLLQLQIERAQSGEQREELEMMVTEIDRLSRTVTNLLRFSRLEKETPDVGSVSLRSLATSMEKVFQGDLESREITLKVHAPEEVEIVSDVDFLKEVLSNLIGNAIEASPRGGRIDVSVLRRENGVEVSVTDQGKGIPRHLKDRVFEPFVTTKTSGTGLGLAIARSRIQQLGGSLQLADSGPDSGSLFVIRLPYPEPEAKT